MIGSLDQILAGFVVACQPLNLVFTFIGVVVGTIIGLLPGIGSAATIALLIPLTFGMDPTPALIMMAGIYYGSMYGSSISSILINTPGEASSVMTCIDGHQMARKGRAGAALAISAWGSFIAGTVSVVVLTMLAVPLAKFALRFGPPEYFLLMLFAMTAVSSLAGDSPAKAMFSAALGLMISTVGIDMQSGQDRFSLGIPELLDGVHFTVIIVGLFAVSEVLQRMEEVHLGTAEIIRLKGKLLLTLDEWRRSLMPICRGGIIGFLTGVLPGAGPIIATIFSYAAEKRFSKHPEEFGHGAIEGVAGPEAANNASSTATMVPLLTLGLPGSATSAVLLGVLIMYGIQPGPLLFVNRPDLVWGLVDSMYVGNVMLIILNIPMIAIFVRILYTPNGILFPLILAIAATGTYGVASSMVDLYLMLLFGVVGYLFDKFEIPSAPMVLSLVLGGMMEQSFRQAMSISGGGLGIFFKNGICILFVVLCVASIALPAVMAFVKNRRASAQGEPS